LWGAWKKKSPNFSPQLKFQKYLKEQLLTLPGYEKVLYSLSSGKLEKEINTSFMECLSTMNNFIPTAKTTSTNVNRFHINHCTASVR